jgi:ribosomal protein S18 acetylase RimI-like enzyme
VSVAPALLTRRIAPDEYPAARRIVATAFADEPFVHAMYGEAALDRFIGLADEYSTWPSSAHAITIGVEAAGHLVAVAVATPPGQCGLCDTFVATERIPATEGERILDEFLAVCRHVHVGNVLPPHAHITTVATDPMLHGSGVGRLLMEALVEHLRTAAIETAVLECLESRAAFYEHCGFVLIDEFDDPGGPDLRGLLMRRDLLPAP